MVPVSNTLSSDRFEFREPIADSEIEAISVDPCVKVVQTSEAAKPDTWRRLDELLFSRRPDIEARVYGFYRHTCDLTFLRHLNNVRRFSADSLHGPVTGIEHVESLPHLESLSIGIWQLEDFSFLNTISPHLRHLAIAATRSRKPSLAPLARFRDLDTLYLEGQQKEIGAVSSLTNLRDVTLRSISTDGLDYLRPLRKLWSLDLKLGGIRDLSAIGGMSQIKYLEVWQVRGLSDLSVVSDLQGLQNLFLQSLPKLNQLPVLSELFALRRVVLMNMKGLRDLGPLEFAPNLQEFALIEASHNEPADLAPVLRNAAIRRVQAGFGSDKKNIAFEAMRESGKLSPFDWGTAFEYQA